ncbi:helix-turn-helix transcriptional regulator [Streptomyces sp. NPDC058301]|uniref:helix-turn-helix transcriptional regulator n=1 Tax=Streptomyces sp. NPDC058301 TaxID=3346436 RepID=UPI0036E8F781
MDFPSALRERRTRRRISQLDLALRAGTTQRHVSFLESGRSEPGRAMVVRLAESLELPLRERNSLLLAAGYAPAYPQTSLKAPELAPVREALDRILAAHAPCPAVVVDRYGGLVAVNDHFALLTEGADPELVGPGANAYRLALHPRGLAPRIGNFPAWARHVVEALRAEVSRNPDERLRELLAELEGYVPEVAPEEAHLGFAVPLELSVPDGPGLRLMTTVTTFATAVDVTVAELKLEAFLPVDRATAEYLAAAAAGRAAAGVTRT